MAVIDSKLDPKSAAYERSCGAGGVADLRAKIAEWSRAAAIPRA
jgi:hypothetical protein